MTTQQSYPEHNDVDTAGGIESHAPETETPTNAPAATATTATASAGEETPEQPAPADVQLTEEQTLPTQPEPEVQEVATPSPEQAEQDHTASHTDASNEGEVKEFTAYIEEFRQAEARFSRAIQEAEAREAQQETTAATSPSITPISSVEEVFVPEFTVAWETPDIAAAPTFERTEEKKETTLTTQPATAAEAETYVTNEANKASIPSETPETTTPPARPVSPLLRPATRIRMPRHSARHREEARAAATEAAPQAEAQTTQSAQNETPTVETPTQPTESTQEVEQPRPARRYRFDNRSKTASTTATVPTPAPTIQTSPASTDTALTNGHSGQGTQTGEREAQQPTKLVQQEQTAKPNATEPIVAENEVAQAQPSSEPERRRKHGQERQRSKEQQAAPQPQAQQPATTVAEIAASLNAQQVIPVVAEPALEQKENVEPEDLPPLEYADLQKANTRRRRRRHTNGASVAALTGNTFPAAPDSPATTPPAPVVQPRPIATPPVAQPRPVVAPSTSLPQRPTATPPSVVTTNQAPYSITSGYTVSQMNQGSDNVGPFMGPEPSPARGTLAAQNVRSIRTDAQRTPAYPVRSTEATSASVNQLANIVAQAIQTQTDRMVAELRRANQAPTNISVSMPPFPSNERVGVFVDVANLLYSARTLRMAVDFGKLLDFLRGNRRLIRAHAYCPTSPQPGDEQMFLQAVKGLGYRITTKNYKTFSSGAKKADLDLDLCMDVVRLVDGRAVDCIVLVSGDSDFMPMLDYCSDHGVRVEVAAFDEAMSATLRQSCDLFINLSMLEEIRA